jgi:uncharacterized membrane protein
MLYNELVIKYREKRQRSIVKALSYRTLIVMADGLVIFLITHRYDVALMVVVISNLYSTVLYFLHERLWDGIKWGKIKA